MFRTSAPLFFVLTNTRGLSAERAAAVTYEACRNLKQALAGSAYFAMHRRDFEPAVVALEEFAAHVCQSA